MPDKTIILVRPTLAENIGLAARAVLACGLKDLRLVAPKDGWPQQRAIKAAAWAGDFLAEVRCFATIEEAAADVKGLVATSARVRSFPLPSLAPSEWAARPVGGLLFGNEKSGLSNHEISLCEGISRLDTVGSLNLSQAVLAYCYELLRHRPPPEQNGVVSAKSPPKRAKTSELQGFYTHLEAELEAADFFYPPQIRAASRQKLRTIFSRTALAANEVKMLRGVITALVSSGRANKGQRGDKTSQIAPVRDMNGVHRCSTLKQVKKKA